MTLISLGFADCEWRKALILNAVGVPVKAPKAGCWFDPAERAKQLGQTFSGSRIVGSTAPKCIVGRIAARRERDRPRVKQLVEPNTIVTG
ncbi:hypothetical protein KTE49_17740 [Burkholderia multivorans]|uniref:hypothetical protein n=1 Tax=Burkholderia multivorans TaxID=87883 RepID=UPI0011B1D8B8|nr:hypothetical protein [Burkholderia multivorans]MBJ9615795.1 hypothetical protein [Burkholderia multivorans]MBU9328717.1 hypothetical protein [Burkholderia multivorans]MBU9532280.1 hypothetical protein [Burkholderia multivorans]MDN7475280.1 hypothetical protein [Burkholderia multivorans]